MEQAGLRFPLRGCHNWVWLLFCELVLFLDERETHLFWGRLQKDTPNLRWILEHESGQWFCIRDHPQRGAPLPRAQPAAVHACARAGPHRVSPRGEAQLLPQTTGGNLHLPTEAGNQKNSWTFVRVLMNPLSHSTSTLGARIVWNIGGQPRSEQYPGVGVWRARCPAAF